MDDLLDKRRKTTCFEKKKKKGILNKKIFMAMK